MDTLPALDHAERAATIPLDELDPSDPRIFQQGAELPYFARLRRDAPVHFCANSMFGPYWSVTRYRDILAVESNPAVFSSHSRHGGITIRDRAPELELPMFIAMDPPEHGAKRAAVQPVFTPENLAELERTIRRNVEEILDGLPLGETFDWVDRVSVELTVRMLATLFDVPQDDRRKLSHWSDCATALPMPGGLIENEEQREREFHAMASYFAGLWNERVNAPPRPDLISLLAHSEATRRMPPREFMGNLVLLIVGGNDTTRNSLSGGALFFHENPAEWEKVRANPALLGASAVPEIIRYQTPLAHMRRTALEDAEVAGQRIRKGDKVVMWYVSGNRDGTAIEEPDLFRVDRERPRKHLSFGFGIHRCVGERLAEMQLRVFWEEVIRRGLRAEVAGPPKRVLSAFVHGFASLPARLAR